MTDQLTNSISRNLKGDYDVKTREEDGVDYVTIFGVPIVSLNMKGTKRLCLAQISGTLLQEFSYNEIHNRRVALGITCMQCTPVQLELLRRSGAMPVSSRRCGLITRREAERLVSSFISETPPPRLPHNFTFRVRHSCGWGCTGLFIPSRYNSSRAKCIECSTCHAYFSPNKFIFHFHKTEGATYRHPDAANFNSWRRHLFLCETDQRSETVLHAWEDLKAMFNGGCRRRPSRTVVQNEAQGGATQLTASTSAETPGYCTPALRTNGFPGPITSDPFCGAIPCPPTRPHTGFALSKSSSISYGEFLRSLSRPYSSNWLTTPSRFGAYVTPVYPSSRLGPPLAHFQTNFISRDPLGGSLARNVPSPIEAERRHRARHQADYHTNQPNAPSARSVFFNEGDLNTEENLSPSSLHSINPVSDDISTDEVRAESAEAPLDVENIVDRNDDKTDEQCVSCIAVEINNDEAKDFEVSGDADKLKNSHNIDSSPLSKETDEMGNMNSDELLRILDEKSDIGDFLKLSRDTLCTLVQSTRDSLEALDNTKTALQASIHLQSVKSKKVHAELTRDLDELKGTITSDIEKERNLKDSLEGKIAEVNRLLHLTMPLSGYHSFG